MSAPQLRLFAPDKPLLARFGPSFWRRLPPAPGVYIMAGARERILYIGQSGNLRARLQAYKRLPKPDTPRRLARLVREVRSITWEICDSPAAAQLRENALLRLHKPAFNVLNTRPEHYAFVACRIRDGDLRLRLSRQPMAQPGETLYGAFKGMDNARRAVGALLRLLWSATRMARSPRDYPLLLSRPCPPPTFSLPLPRTGWAPWAEQLDLFWSGASEQLLSSIADHLPQGQEVGPFQRHFWARDLERLAAFYRGGPRRHHHLRSCLGLGPGPIAQRALDDCLVLGKGESPSSTQTR